MVGSTGVPTAAASGRAQSEVIGVLLLTAVVVVSASVVGAGVIANFSSQAEAGDVLTDTDVNITADNVTVTHRGGDTLADSAVEVVARNGPSERRYELSTDAIARTGDGDGQFEPGERAVFAHSLRGTVSALVVDTERNTVLGRTEARVSGTSDDPPNFVVRIDNADSPVAEGETLTVRPTVTNRGDRRATQEVNLTVDGAEVDTQELTLEAGRSEQIELTWTTTTGVAGNYTAVVASENDSDSAPVAVQTPAFFDVTIDDTNSPVETGRNLTVNATVANTGEEGGVQGIDLNVSGLGTPFDFEQVGLNGGDSVQLTLANATEPGDAGDYTAVVASGDTTDSVSVRITSGAPFVDRIVVEDAPIDYEEAGNKPKQNITVVFDEAMNQSVDPTVDVRNVSVTYPSSGDGWVNDTAYVETVNFQQNDEDVVATVNVTGAEDLDGNIQVPAETTFLVDTQPPGDVNDVTVRPDINASNQGAVTYGVANPGTVYGDEDIRVTLTGPAGTTVTNRTPLQAGGDNVTNVTFDTSALADGNAAVAIEAVAIDDLNNTGSSVQASKVTKDTVAPSVSDFSATGQKDQLTVTFNATEVTTDIVGVAISADGPGTIDKTGGSNNTVGNTTSYEITYSVTQNGIYDVKLVRILDTVGNNGSSGQTDPADTSPGNSGGTFADAGGPYSVDEDNSITLDGSGSSFGPGREDGYNWTITSGPGSLSDKDTETPTYTAPSDVDSDTTVKVQLTVNTNKDSDTDTTTVTVRDTGPQISDFLATNPQSTEIQASFDASEQVSDINVTIDRSGTRVTVIDESDFSTSDTSAPFTYTATYDPGTSDTYEATLNVAADSEGNNGASGESATVDTGSGGGDNRPLPGIDGITDNSQDCEKSGNSGNCKQGSTPTASFDISWSADDVDGDLTDVTVELEAPDGTIVDTTTYSGPETSSASGTVTLTDELSEWPGPAYTIRVDATDANSNSETVTEQEAADGEPG